MSTIRDSNLPGVGHKFQVETLSGDRLTIVIHDDGTRELYHFSRKDLDRPASVLTLTDGEARQIAGIVGGLTYVPRAIPFSEVVLEDLVLEWFTLPSDAVSEGKTIGDLRVRTRTGASIVSIVEPNRLTRTNPDADTVLSEGATLIIAGDRHSLARTKELLMTGKHD